MSHTNERQAAIQADLWPGSAWQEEDLRDLMELVKPFGDVDGLRSYMMRGTGLQVTLAFVAGAVAGGFFNALGEHIYSHLTKKVTEFLKRPQRRHPEWRAEDERDGLFFILQDRELRLDLHLYGWMRNDEEIGEFLSVAPNAYFAIIEAVKVGRSPCIRGKAHTIHATWCEGRVREWDISVTVSEGDDPEHGRCLLGLEGFVPSEKLSISEWPFIQWMDRASACARREERRNAHHAR